MKIKRKPKAEPKVEMVTISKEEYESLLEDSDKLNRLEVYGVDNWGGYSDAMCDEMGLFKDGEEE